jgi:MoaA/NifB/PqqE/SkfB family radical SAM enzyme
MCWEWKNKPDPDELNIKQWKDFVISLNGGFDPALEIGITGGEPLFKEGVLDLIRICSDNGLRTVLTTNGYLIDARMAKKIVESGLTLIFLSLDSLEEKTHDFLRGIEGAYAKVMRAIDYLDKVRNGLEIGIQTFINNENLDGITELMKWIDGNSRINTNYVQAMNIPINSLPDATWYKREDFSFLWPKDIQRTNSVIDELIGLKKNKSKISNSIPHLDSFKSYFENPHEVKRTRICPFGYSALNISTRGDVYLCWEMESLGNIKVDKIKDLWLSEKAEQVRKKMNDCQKNCPAIINCSF